VLCRDRALAAMREESKLIAELNATIDAHLRAIEHCRVASETDPEWFTLDVQDCHARKVRLLREILAKLEADAVPLPQDVSVGDTVRGRLYAGYAQSAQATERLASRLQESEHVQTAATGMRSAFGALSNRLRTLSSADALGADGVVGRMPSFSASPVAGTSPTVAASSSSSGAAAGGYPAAAAATAPPSNTATAATASSEGAAVREAPEEEEEGSGRGGLTPATGEAQAAATAAAAGEASQSAAPATPAAASADAVSTPLAAEASPSLSKAPPVQAH